MPNKKDYSSLMTNKEFFTKWIKWEPLVYRVTLSHIRKYQLHTRPGYAEVADVVGEIREVMQRLGVFARWNPGVQTEAKYLGSRVKCIIQHMWQDHCRINTRYSVPLSTVGHDPADVSSNDKASYLDGMAAVDNAVNHDSDFDWSYGIGAADDTTSERMAFDALANALAYMQPAKKVTLAAQALTYMRKSQTLAAAPTIAALQAVLNLEESTATTVRATLRAAAASVRSECWA